MRCCEYLLYNRLLAGVCYSGSRMKDYVRYMCWICSQEFPGRCYEDVLIKKEKSVLILTDATPNSGFLVQEGGRGRTKAAGWAQKWSERLLSNCQTE